MKYIFDYLTLLSLNVQDILVPGVVTGYECFEPSPIQNTNVYHMVVQCSQMFADIKHSITFFNEHLFDVCEDSSKCEKHLCLAGERLMLTLITL